MPPETAGQHNFSPPTKTCSHSSSSFLLPEPKMLFRTFRQARGRCAVEHARKFCFAVLAELPSITPRRIHAGGVRGRGSRNQNFGHHIPRPPGHQRVRFIRSSFPATPWPPAPEMLRSKHWKKEKHLFPMLGTGHGGTSCAPARRTLRFQWLERSQAHFPTTGNHARQAAQRVKVSNAWKLHAFARLQKVPMVGKAACSQL